MLRHLSVLFLNLYLLLPTVISAQQMVSFGGGETTWYPTWRPATESMEMSVDDIEYYGCSAGKVKVLRNMFAKQAGAAAWMRDVINDQTGNDTTAFMLDLAFGFGFSRAENASDNMILVRDRYDAMAKGYCRNPGNANEISPIRVGCMDKKITDFVSKQKGWKRTDSMAGAKDRQALIIIWDHFWFSKEEFDKNFQNLICSHADPSIKLTRALHYASFLSHEMAHLAGVEAWFPEVYDTNILVGLNVGQALANAQNYAFPIMNHMSGCAEPLFSKYKVTYTGSTVQDHEDVYNDELRRSRKLLSANDTDKPDVKTFDGAPIGITNETDIPTEAIYAIAITDRDAEPSPDDPATEDV
ncbi:MAG: hypothetical protein M1831_005612 [Alyxoria varia]|nr:MAG: hypothetical protein M1831_005612 [Alyxoria varia]